MLSTLSRIFLSNGKHPRLPFSGWPICLTGKLGRGSETGTYRISKHKMATTVKKDGIRKRRFAQISTKHALSTPYSLQW